MTKPIIVVKVPCKLLYVTQVKEFLIKCSTSWPYLISEFLVAYITIVASDWPCTFFTPKVFLFSILLRCVTVRYPSTERSKYSNCTVNLSKYLEENQKICFHHHHQACLIHCFGLDQTPLLMHVIQCRIWVRPGYFINWVRPA